MLTADKMEIVMHCF